MHELGITQGIIDRARDAAVTHHARRVGALFLVMTPAADFTEDSIRMYFAMLTADDELLQGAELHFIHEPADAQCVECEHSFRISSADEVCPACSSRAIRVDSTAPMIQLSDIEIDDDQEETGGGA